MVWRETVRRNKQASSAKLIVTALIGQDDRRPALQVVLCRLHAVNLPDPPTPAGVS